VERPRFPTAEELKRAESYAPGSGASLIKTYIHSLEVFYAHTAEESREAVRNSRHTRTYRYCALIAGLLLASGSLSLCVYAIQVQANIAQVAMVLAPVGVLAGVFLVGARPSKSKALTKTPFSGTLRVDDPTE
jgi:hypothetical protein